MASLSRILTFALVSMAMALPAAAQTRIYQLQSRYLFVLDGSSFQQLARLDLVSQGNPAGIAVTGSGSRAYIGLGGAMSWAVPGETSAGTQPRVAVLDLLTMSVVRTIAVGAQPIDVVASPSGDRVYVANRGDLSVSVIRTSDDSVIATISLPLSPSVLAVSSDGAQLYAAGSLPGTAGSAAVAVSTSTFAVGASYAAPGCAQGLAVSPDGARLYVSGVCAGTSLFAYDTTTGTRIAAVGPSATGRLTVTSDGTRLIAGGGTVNPTSTIVWDTATMTQIASATPTGSYVALDPSETRAFTWGFTGNSSGPNTGRTRLAVLDLSSYAATSAFDQGSQISATGLAVAPVSACGQFIATPSYSGVTIAGGSGSFSAPVPAGCPWSVTSTDTWLTITSATSGTGPATITYSATPSTGPRTAELHINGQALAVYQTQPLVQIDAPAAGSRVVQGFQLAGWVGDLASAGPASPVLTDPLVLHVWAYPSSGGAPTFIGQSSGNGSRPDVASAFPGYRTGGFDMTVTGLAPGTYTFVVYLYSPYLNAFAAARTVTLTVDPSLFAVIDTLPPDASVTVPFRLGGWALDASAASGTGVDVVNVYAYPDSGGAPIFAGSAFYGLPRGDLIPYVGERFRDSGFGLAVDGLAPGGYTMVAFAHSTVSGRFQPAVVHVTVTGAAEPLEIETFGIPPHGNPRAIFATGWAIDRRASSGTGVTAIQAWAYPANGGPPIFVGSAQMPFARNDIASIYGARYRDSGWTLGGTLPSGSYQVVFFALSAATGQFDNVRVRSLIVP